MATRLSTAGIQVWFSIAVIAWFFVFPVIAISFTESDGISTECTLSSMGSVVFGTTQNSTLISIIADHTCTPIIRYTNDSYFTVSQNYDHQIISSISDLNHTIEITDLEQGTKYHYHVSGCEAQDIDRTFSTYPATGSCAFIVYADTREQAPLYNQTERHKRVADQIAKEKDVMFVVNSGDLVSNSSDPAEWLRFFEATENLRSMTSYYAIPGNHDADRMLFRQLFGTDKTNFFDCGNTRIALLDSTDESSMTLEEQADWILSAFGSYNGAKIVILHYPVYSSDEKHYGGWENIQRTLVPAFQESGVRLVFNGHVHAFEQVNRDGITYITEARGGAPAYPLNETRIPGSVRSYENTLGYSRVTVDPGAGVISVNVIRIADVSGDLRNVTKIYPDGTIDAKIRIPSGTYFHRLPDISKIFCLLKEMNYKSECRPTFLNYFSDF